MDTFVQSEVEAVSKGGALILPKGRVQLFGDPEIEKNESKVKVFEGRYTLHTRRLQRPGDRRKQSCQPRCRTRAEKEEAQIRQNTTSS